MPTISKELPPPKPKKTNRELTREAEEEEDTLRRVNRVAREVTDFLNNNNAISNERNKRRGKNPQGTAEEEMEEALENPMQDTLDDLTVWATPVIRKPASTNPRDIYTNRKEKDFVYEFPDMQREAEWDTPIRQGLIDSMLKGLPIGSFTYRVEMPDKPGVKYIIDGHNRFLAIQDFTMNVYTTSDGRYYRQWNKEEIAKGKTPLPKERMLSREEKTRFNSYNIYVDEMICTDTQAVIMFLRSQICLKLSLGSRVRCIQTRVPHLHQLFYMDKEEGEEQTQRGEFIAFESLYRERAYRKKASALDDHYHIIFAAAYYQTGFWPSNKNEDLLEFAAKHIIGEDVCTKISTALEEFVSTFSKVKKGKFKHTKTNTTDALLMLSTSPHINRFVDRKSGLQVFRDFYVDFLKFHSEQNKLNSNRPPKNFQSALDEKFWDDERLITIQKEYKRRGNSDATGSRPSIKGRLELLNEVFEEYILEYYADKIDLPPPTTTKKKKSKSKQDVTSSFVDVANRTEVGLAVNHTVTTTTTTTRTQASAANREEGNSSKEMEVELAVTPSSNETGKRKRSQALTSSPVVDLAIENELPGEICAQIYKEHIEETSSKKQKTTPTASSTPHLPVQNKITKYMAPLEDQTKRPSNQTTASKQVASKTVVQPQLIIIEIDKDNNHTYSSTLMLSLVKKDKTDSLQESHMVFKLTNITRSEDVLKVLRGLTIQSSVGLILATNQGTDSCIAGVKTKYIIEAICKLWPDKLSFIYVSAPQSLEHCMKWICAEPNPLPPQVTVTGYCKWISHTYRLEMDGDFFDNLLIQGLPIRQAFALAYGTRGSAVEYVQYPPDEEELARISDTEEKSPSPVTQRQPTPPPPSPSLPVGDGGKLLGQVTRELEKRHGSPTQEPPAIPEEEFQKRTKQKDQQPVPSPASVVVEEEPETEDESEDDYDDGEVAAKGWHVNYRS